jgi:protoheme IX farnesyltransferase
VTGVEGAVARAGAGSLVRDFVALTKPRIISLLLVTTIAPMFVAGTPSWGLVLAVTVGGYLMAGGANAVNMYLDRDIDDRMARTRLRPIPSGRLGATVVVAFGVAISSAATWVLAYFANILTAALALGGFYCYVFVYTRWLKRTTPHNIVIGGAAGAFPPARGVGGGHERDRPRRGVPVPDRVLLDAAALLGARAAQAGGLRRAGVPMAPLVWGEAETTRQMVWYTVILLALTVLPVLFGAFGLVYLVAAIAFGVPLLVGVRAHQRAADWSAPAAGCSSTRCSYLALLFVAMAVDRTRSSTGGPGARASMSGAIGAGRAHRRRAATRQRGDRAAVESGGESALVQCGRRPRRAHPGVRALRSRGELVEVREFAPGCAPLEFTRHCATSSRPLRARASRAPRAEREPVRDPALAGRAGVSARSGPVPVRAPRRATFHRDRAGHPHLASSATGDGRGAARPPARRGFSGSSCRACARSPAASRWPRCAW